MQNQYNRPRMLSTLTMAAVLFVQTVTITAQTPIANFLADTHPVYDRVFSIKLDTGINPSVMQKGDFDDIDGTASYRKGDSFRARVRVTKLNKDIIKIKVLWIDIGGRYYFPNATLVSIRVDNETAGMPVRNTEGLENVAMVRTSDLRLPSSSSDTKAPEAPKVPLNFGTRGTGPIVVLEPSVSFSNAYQAIVGLWNVGSWISDKIKSSGKSLPHERTVLVFQFLGIDKVPDMGTEEPKYLIVENQLAPKEKKQLASKESLKTLLKNCN